MTSVLWANVLLTIPFLLAFIAIPLWMTFKRPQRRPDHSQAHAYLRAKAAFGQPSPGTATPGRPGMRHAA